MLKIILNRLKPQMAGEEEELAKLVEYLDKASTAYGMEISTEKTKLITNNYSDINTEIKVNGQMLEIGTHFKHLGSVITDKGSKLFSDSTAASTSLRRMDRSSSVSVRGRFKTDGSPLVL